ncbi:MAG: peptide-binding protein [Candidatus Latescibacterota bacterium]|nr:MAG: peptide-binding protein [Candidatus Latescibacterota bacterium]
MRFVGRGFLIGIFCLALSLPLASCGGGGGEQASESRPQIAKETPLQGGVIFRHLESDCKTLNWVLYNTNYEIYVLRHLYDYLLDYDQHLDIVPVLAESFDVSKDGLRITVALKDSLFWHDGEPITSEDVKFTVDKILDPTVPAVNKEGWFSRLDDVEIVDEKTMVFVWKEPYGPSLHALTQLAPIPKHIYGDGDFLKHPANREPVGSGAFKFEEWRTGQRISVVRNDNYYGSPAHLERVVFKIIPDRSVALAALKTGELDEMRVNQIQWDEQTDNADFKRKFNRQRYDIPQYNYFAWNCRSIWFRDARVRRAMTMLFDRKTVNAELYSGHAKIVTGPFYVNSWAYDSSIEPLPFDPNAAKQLLDEAGWTDSDGDGIRDQDGIKFEFDFYVISGNKTAIRFAELLRESCERAGIVVNARPLEGATFFDKMFKGEYDAGVLAWRLDNDPDIFDTFHSTQVPPIGLNHTFYSNPEVDQLLERGRAEVDQNKRRDIYHRAHQLIHDDQPYTFLNSVPEKRPINKRIGNVVISPAGPFDFYPGSIYWFVKEEK